MQATGARLFRGEGKLIDRRTVMVGEERLSARRAVVIANGGTAVVPGIPGLDSVEYWTNRQAALPRELPASMVVLGGGWDIGTAERRAAWAKGEKASLYPYGTTQARVFAEGD